MVAYENNGIGPRVRDIILESVIKVVLAADTSYTIRVPRGNLAIISAIP